MPFKNQSINVRTSLYSCSNFAVFSSSVRLPSKNTVRSSCSTVALYMGHSDPYLAGLNKLVNKYPNKQRRYKLLVGCGERDIPMEIDIVNE